MNYGNLVRRPFEIVRHHPYLWFLGLLAGGATTFNWSSGNYRTGNGTAFYNGPSTATLQAFWNNNWEWITALAAALLLIGVVFFVLGCIATGGIIRAAAAHDDGHDYRLGAAWREGYATFWRIAGIKLTTFVLALAAAILVGALTGATVAFANVFVPAAVLFGLLTAVAALASVVFWIWLGLACELGERFIVLEDRKVFDSLGDGFRMVRWHFKEVALGWLILIAISIVAGIAIAVIAVAVAIPAALFGISGLLGGPAGVVVTGSIAVVFFVGVLLAVAGAWSAYSSVFWTLLFRTVRALPVAAPRGAIAPA